MNDMYVDLAPRNENSLFFPSVMQTKRTTIISGVCLLLSLSAVACAINSFASDRNHQLGCFGSMASLNRLQ